MRNIRGGKSEDVVLPVIVHIHTGGVALDAVSPRVNLQIRFIDSFGKIYADICRTDGRFPFCRKHVERKIILQPVAIGITDYIVAQRISMASVNEPVRIADSDNLLKQFVLRNTFHLISFSLRADVFYGIDSQVIGNISVNSVPRFMEIDGNRFCYTAHVVFADPDFHVVTFRSVSRAIGKNTCCSRLQQD